MVKKNYYFLLILFVSVFYISPVFANDTLDPFVAEFLIFPDDSAALSDIKVTLDFSIHNPAKGKLTGSKFICTEDIESMVVTDGKNNKMPFSIKEYPRKRIIWEYPSADRGVRKINISFIMKDAVQKKGDTYSMNVDWAVGWNRQVLNAQYSIILPENITKDDIVYAFPKNYRFEGTSKAKKVIYSFTELNAKSLSLIFKDKGAPPSVEKKIRKDESKKSVKKDGSKKYLLKDVRFGPHDSNTDRLVFDLNKKIPYKLSQDAEKGEVEVSWTVPVEVSGKIQKKKNINTKYIKGLTWKKSSSKKLSGILKLKGNNLKIKYGYLNKPPRFYVDVSDPGKRKPVEQTTKKKINKIGEKPEKTVPPVKIEEEQIREENLKSEKIASNTTSSINQTTSTTTVDLLKSEPPLEEKLANMNVQKLYKSGNYPEAILAFETFLEKYPKTVLKEDMLLKIADSYYQIGENTDPEKYDNAIEAYKNVLLNFPGSDHSAYATFQIAECYRKRKFVMEAKGHYSNFIEKYPQKKLIADASFWAAECLFQMEKFEEALKEFEKFIYNFPSGPYLKEATFRLADCYAHLKDFDRAEYYYEKAMKRWPDMSQLSVETMNNLAMTYYHKGKFEKSRKAFFSSYNLFPLQDDPARLLRFIGDAYQWEGQMQEALNIYGYLITTFPVAKESLIGVMRIADLGVNVSGLASKNFTYNEINPYLDPEKAFRLVIEKDSTGKLLTEAFYKLGFVLAKRGKFPEAIQYFKRSLYRKDRAIYSKRSFENIQKIIVKMIEKASDDQEHFSVVELYKRNAESFLDTIEDCDFLYKIASSYFELGFLEESEVINNRILKKTNNNDCMQKSILCLSKIAMNQGQPEKAEEMLNHLLYDKSLEKSASFSNTIYHIFGDAFFEQKKYQQAVEAYTVVLEKRGKTFRYAKSLFRIGESFGRTGYYYNGTETLKNFLALAEQIVPQTDELVILKDNARLLMGDFLEKKKNYNAAINVYKALAGTTIDSEKKGWALLKWGDILMKTGDSETASKKYAAVAEQMPFNFLGKFAQFKIDESEWAKSLQPDIERFL